MTPDEWRLVLGGLLGGTTIPAVVQAVATLVRGKRDDELAEVDITERIQRIAAAAVADAERSAAAAAARAKRAEDKADKALSETEALREQARRAADELDRVYRWIEDGMPDPRPTRPDWLPRRGRQRR